MRYHYFDLDQPDEDDRALKQAIADGRVPASCLAGGTMLQHLDDPPCRTCPASEEVRMRCGGGVTDHIFDTKALVGHTAVLARQHHQAALKAARDTQRRELDALMAQEEE